MTPIGLAGFDRPRLANSANSNDSYRREIA
jgi:hypothetical protein